MRKSIIILLLHISPLWAYMQNNFISIQNMDGKFYTNSEGQEYPEQVNKIVAIDDSSYTLFHVAWLKDFSQYLSVFSKEGKLITSYQLPGNINDNILGFGDLQKDDEFYYYTRGLNNIPGVKIIKYDLHFNKVQEEDFPFENETKEFNYLKSFLYKDFIVSYGWMNKEVECGENINSKVLWVNKKELIRDTLIDKYYLEGNSFAHLEHLIDIENNVTFLTSKKSKFSSIGKKLGLITYNDNAEEVKEWTSEKQESALSHYHFTQLLDSSYVMTIKIGLFGNVSRFQKINTSGNIEWTTIPLRGFPFGSPSANMNTFKIITAKNGDIIGCGTMFWQYREINFDSLNKVYSDTGQAGFDYLYSLYNRCYPTATPYIFRLSSDGIMLWEKAVILTDSLDQVSSGTLYDLYEEENGDIVYGGRIGTFTSYEPNQQQPHNSNSILMRLTADGCYEGYPCTKLKTFLQPSRVLPYFNTKNTWLLNDKNKGNKQYVRFSDTTKVIENKEYYVLQSSQDSVFSTSKDIAHYRVVNEAIYSLEGNTERPVFNYFIFPTEEWRDTITLDTAYFTTIGNGLRTKQFIYSSNKDSTQKYIWYNEMGCSEDFLFDSFNPSSTLPIWQICKFWKDGVLKYEHPDLLCETNGISDLQNENIYIYPNPIHDILHIDAGNSNISYVISDLLGRIIFKGSGSNLIEINTQHWVKSQSYIVTILDEYKRKIKNKLFFKN